MTKVEYLLIQTPENITVEQKSSKLFSKIRVFKKKKIMLYLTIIYL